VCDLETSRMGAPYIYDISHLRVNICLIMCDCRLPLQCKCDVRSLGIFTKRRVVNFMFF